MTDRGAQGWSRSGSWTLATAAMLAALWSGGLIAFSRSIPETVVDRTTPTDAIIVLTGGSKRVVTGLRKTLITACVTVQRSLAARA